jgi:hypothetical protein
MTKIKKHSRFINWLLHLFTPVMVGIRYRVTGEEFERHIRERIGTLEAYGKRWADSNIVLSPKAQYDYEFHLRVYKFGLTHIDFSYTYFLDESEIGEWEFIQAMDSFDKLDCGKPATPSKIVKPAFIH